MRAKSSPKCFAFTCRSISRYITATAAATAKAASPSSAMVTCTGSSGPCSEGGSGATAVQQHHRQHHRHAPAA